MIAKNRPIPAPIPNFRLLGIELIIQALIGVNEINKNKVTNLKDELADVYYWLLLLADHYDIDIDDALEEKIKKNEKKYPIDKSKRSSEKYSEFN